MTADEIHRRASDSTLAFYRIFSKRYERARQAERLQAEQVEADEWYAAEVERMKERAPA